MFLSFFTAMVSLTIKAILLVAFVNYIGSVNGLPVSSDRDAGPPPSTRPTPVGLRSQEPDTNLTIDQLILQSMGGLDAFSAAPGVMAQEGYILTELDMNLTCEQFYSLYGFPASGHVDDQYSFQRKAIWDVSNRWPAGNVPYTIVENDYSEKDRYWIKRAMTEWERYTCVNFRQSTAADRNLVRFQSGTGCNSPLGMVGGVQALNLHNPNCRWKGLYLHEMGHALGLVHEHQLSTRDNFINVLYQNVDPSMRIWFNKYTASEVNQYSVQYDYSSVMHYGITAFSVDSKLETIQAKYPDKENEIGKVYLKELSFSDVKTVNLMYNCASHCPDDLWCTDGGFVDQNCKCICPDGTNDCQTTSGGETTPQQDQQCVNQANGWKCAVLANQGECFRNIDWMWENCAKACGYCGAVKPTGNVCKDGYPQAKCVVWRKRGDCVTNPGWMKKYCEKTCNFCDGTSKPEIDCENAHPDSAECDQWALKGDCRANSMWMSANCRKSCWMCHVKVVKPDVDKDVSCVDTNSNCAYWAAHNYCKTNAPYMLTNCRKSCNSCTDVSCVDTNSNCAYWAANNYCKTNAPYMLNNCRKSCNSCKDVSCVDTNSNCAYWAAHNYCKTNAPYMLNNCRKSCNSCKDVSCVDTNSNCAYWAAHNYCKTNAPYMLTNCRKSCNSCKDASCVDTNINCVYWAAHNYCGSHAAYMLKNCRKSCTNCKGTPCVDTNKNCGYWAANNYCDSYAPYMLKNCRKSCNRCEGTSCADTNINCAYWAAHNYCKTNASYMLKKCRKSCNSCKA